jgi:hypothetical protein
MDNSVSGVACHIQYPYLGAKALCMTAEIAAIRTGQNDIGHQKVDCSSGFQNV